MTNRDPRDVRSEYESAPSPQEWWRVEVARFLYPDVSFADAYAGSLSYMESVLKDVDTLSKEQFEAGTLIGFELRLESGAEVRKAMFPRLPTPGALLWLCCDLAKPGDIIVVRHYIAHKDMVEMRAPWPFSMDVAVSLVSPDPAALVPPPRRRFGRR